MCGIIGVFHHKRASQLVKRGLNYMKRGNDGYGISTPAISKSRVLSRIALKKSDCAVGHCLHSVIGNLMQPLKGDGVLAANCEIYNWMELARKYCISAKNDAELMLGLFDRTKVCEAAEWLDGDYAFCYWKGRVVLGRDLIGVKPLFFSHAGGFAFASEKKILHRLGFFDVRELNPRTFLTYDPQNDRIYFTKRNFHSTAPANNGALLRNKLIEAVKKRIPKRKLGLLFSGGVDSSVLAIILKKLGIDFTCYTAVLDEPGMSSAEDLEYATRVALEYGLKLRVRKLKVKDIPRYLKKIVPLIEDSNVTKVSVGLTFYPACELAKKDGVKVIFSGLGSEEIFAGYQRHKLSTDINKECLSGLLKMYERDTYRDDTITMANDLELRVPFLDRDLISYALKIPSNKKINKGTDKLILRESAVKLGLKPEFAFRKKRAAQYGSKMLRAISKLAKKDGFHLKSDFLRQFYEEHNLRLTALVSGGKDSLYAAWVMQRQNYDITCLVTLKSVNPHSYMFHTPAIDMVRLQARAMDLPVLMHKTTGVKEEELNDLKIALKKAKDKYHIEGVVTGALYSSYQRDRVEKICDELGLKVFSPLWHVNQETLMNEILDSGFKFIFTRVAAMGLDKTWLGRPVGHKDVIKLARLNRKFGLNIAGEGGEFESLVVDAPNFSKKITINGIIKMENAITGDYLITDARLDQR